MSDVSLNSNFNSEQLTYLPRFFARVVSSESWQDNFEAKKYSNLGSIKGWGKRYRIRIFSVHTPNKSIVDDQKLVMANTVLPVTAGSGHGGTSETPQINSGAIVTGFFMDGMDMQEPYIDGVLGNSNNKVPKKQPGGPLGGMQTFNDTYENTKVPDFLIGTVDLDGSKVLSTYESLQLKSLKAYEEQDKDKKKVQKLANPCKSKNSDTKGIQRSMKNLINGVEELKKSANEIIGLAGSADTIVNNLIGEAGSTLDNINQIVALQSPITNTAQLLDRASALSGSKALGQLASFGSAATSVENSLNLENIATQKIAKDIEKLVDNATREITPLMKNIVNDVRGYSEKIIAEEAKIAMPYLYPTEIPDLTQLTHQANEKLNCTINSNINDLFPKVKDLLQNILDKDINSPICASEELSSNYLSGGFLDDVISTLNEGVNPLKNLVGLVPEVQGNLFNSLDIASSIVEFFNCDDSPECPSVNEISLQGPASDGDVDLGPSAPSNNYTNQNSYASIVDKYNNKPPAEQLTVAEQNEVRDAIEFERSLNEYSGDLTPEQKEEVKGSLELF